MFSSADCRSLVVNYLFLIVSMNKEIRVAFTGGGTGGHIFPLIGVAAELKKILPDTDERKCAYYYFGAPSPFAKDFISLGVKIVPLISFKWRRYLSILNIVDIFKAPFAFLLAFLKMFFIMPDVLFSKGGTSVLPAVCAAWFFRVPVFVHESDSIPGLSNSVSFSFAKRIALSFEKTCDYTEGERVAVVGNPVRPFLLEPSEDLDQERAKKIFGFDPKLPLILVLGGSQGSSRINDFFLDNVKALVEKYQVLHQTGAENFENVRAELAVVSKNFIAPERERYKIVNFFDKQIKEALLACDIAVARAGSGSIFEIALYGKPSILIPLKEASRNHQFFNAYEYASRGACSVIEEDNLDDTIFFHELEVIAKKDNYARMSENALKFAKPRAGEMIAREIVNLLVEKRII